MVSGIRRSTVFDQVHPIRVGVIARLPLTNVQDVDAFQPPLRAVQSGDGATNNQGVMGRGALRVRVSAHGAAIDLVSCHLKSKLLQFPGGFQPADEGERARSGAYALYRRAAQATTIREFAGGLLDGDGKNRAVIVLGDLNDEPLAATTQILLGPPGSEIGTPGELHPDKGDAWRLWNLAPRIPEAHRFSRYSTAAASSSTTSWSATLSSPAQRMSTPVCRTCPPSPATPRRAATTPRPTTRP